jgi:sugar-specific transcriptional regulator TrmB
MVLTHNKQNHSCVSVEEVAQKQREILESSCATLDEKLSEGKKALNNISGVMKSLEENTSSTKEKIMEQAKIIAKVVSDQLVGRAEDMCWEVDEIYDELHTELSQQHDEIKEYIDKVQGNLSCNERCLDNNGLGDSPVTCVTFRQPFCCCSRP